MYTMKFKIVCIIILFYTTIKQTREGIQFKSVQNKKHGGSRMAQFSVCIETECAVRCLATSGCRSLNIGPLDGNVHTCELFSSVQMDVSRLQDSSGWIYMYSGMCQFTFDGSCYWQATDTKLPYSDAKSLCQAQGGHLIDIHSDAENTFVYDMRKIAWLAAEKDGDVFKWYTTREIVDTTYSNWDSNATDSESCAVIWRDNARWNPIPCDWTRHVYCEYP